MSLPQFIWNSGTQEGRFPAFLISKLARMSVLCLSLGLAAPALVLAQSYPPQGVEYAVAGLLPGDQVSPALSLKTSGGFLVWQDNITDGEGLGISARRLDSSLSGTLSSFRVNQQGALDQERPQVSLLNDGGAVFDLPRSPVDRPWRKLVDTSLIVQPTHRDAPQVNGTVALTSHAIAVLARSV